MKPSSVLFSVNVNLKMTLLQVYATLQGSRDLHSCLTGSNTAAWQTGAAQRRAQTSQVHHGASPLATAFILCAVQGPVLLHSLHNASPRLWEAFNIFA